MSFDRSPALDLVEAELFQQLTTAWVKRIVWRAERTRRRGLVPRTRPGSFFERDELRRRTLEYDLAESHWRAADRCFRAALQEHTLLLISVGALSCATKERWHILLAFD